MSVAQMSVGQLTGSTSQEISYAGLDHVSVRRGLFPGNGAVAFGGPSGSWVLAGVANDFAAAFGTYLSTRIREHAAIVAPQQASTAPAESQSPAPGDVARLIGDLADLKERGALTDAEFEAKKADLLSRL